MNELLYHVIELDGMYLCNRRRGISGDRWGAFQSACYFPKAEAERRKAEAVQAAKDWGMNPTLPAEYEKWQIVPVNEAVLKTIRGDSHVD